MLRFKEGKMLLLPLKKNTDHEMIFSWEGGGCSGAVWGTAIGRSDRQFYYYTKTENFKNLE
jgi:hypothetical protein